MAKTQKRKTKISGAAEPKPRKKAIQWNFPWNKKNFILLAAGLAVILIGFALMATGITEEPAVPEGTWNNPMAVTIAPILLVAGYCVIIPYAIIKLFKKEESE
jgi:membrane-bound ClpP family serine protease